MTQFLTEAALTEPKRSLGRAVAQPLLRVVRHTTKVGGSVREFLQGQPPAWLPFSCGTGMVCLLAVTAVTCSWW